MMDSKILERFKAINGVETLHNASSGSEDGNKKIEMLLGKSNDVTDKDLAEFFLDQIYLFLIEKRGKEEIYEGVANLEKIVKQYLEDIKYW